MGDLNVLLMVSDGAEGRPLNTADFAASRTGAASEGKLEAVRSLLETLDAKDFATQATAEAVRALLVSTDFAAEATLQDLRVAVATEQTLAALDARVATAAGQAAAQAILQALKERADLLATAAGQYEQRPTEKPGRSYVAAQADAISANATVYEVTAGKRLFITSWGVSWRNTSPNNMGHVRLRDGGVGGPVLASWVLPTSVVGAIAPHDALTNSFPEPKRAISDLFLEVVSGTIAFSFQATGYEEAI